MDENENCLEERKPGVMQEQISKVGEVTVVQIGATCCSNLALQDSCMNTRLSTTAQWCAPAKRSNKKPQLCCYTHCDPFYIFMLKTAYTSPISDVFESVVTVLKLTLKILLLHLTI